MIELKWFCYLKFSIIFVNLGSVLMFSCYFLLFVKFNWSLLSLKRVMIFSSLMIVDLGKKFLVRFSNKFLWLNLGLFVIVIVGMVFLNVSKLKRDWILLKILFIEFLIIFIWLGLVVMFIVYFFGFFVVEFCFILSCIILLEVFFRFLILVFFIDFEKKFSFVYYFFWFCIFFL